MDQYGYTWVQLNHSRAILTGIFCHGALHGINMEHPNSEGSAYESTLTPRSKIWDDTVRRLHVAYPFVEEE